METKFGDMFRKQITKSLVVGGRGLGARMKTEKGLGGTNYH